MSEMRQCPMCHREHEVADDDTIQTWDVKWTGDEAPPAFVKAYLSSDRYKRLLELRAKYPNRTIKSELDNKPDIPGFISNRESNFIHYEDAQSEYNWIKGILQQRGDWLRQQKHLTLTEGERATWDELFGENAIGHWEA